MIVLADNISPNTLVHTSTTFSLINTCNMDCIKISKDVKSCRIGVLFSVCIQEQGTLLYGHLFVNMTSLMCLAILV